VPTPSPTGDGGAGTGLDANVPPVADAGANRTSAPGELVEFDGAASYDPDVTGAWSRGPDLPTQRGLPASAVLGDALYVVAGYQMSAPGADWHPVEGTLVLDAGATGWRALPPIPAPRSRGAGLMFEGRIRVYGGADPVLLDRVDEFDPSNGTWTRIDPMPRNHVVSVASFGGDIYLWDDLMQELWRQVQGAGPWTEMTPPPVGLANGQLVPLGGRLFYPSAHYSPLGALDGMVLASYDPSTGNWTQEPPPTFIRCNQGVVAFRSLLVVLSGEDCRGQIGFVSETEAFDPRTGLWHVLPDIPTPRDEFASGVIRDCIYTAGGSGLDHFLQYQNTEVYCAPLVFEWDFGDGANASGEGANHSYATPGTYTVA